MTTRDPLNHSRWFLWLTIYALLSLVLLAPMSCQLDERLPDDGDSLQNLWILWWGATHLELGYPNIYEANDYYPHPSALLYSEPQFLTSAWSSVLFRTLDNHVLVFNLITIIGLTLSAFAAHIFIRELTGNTFAAFLGGALYAFNAYHFAQLPRSQLIQAQWIPLGIWSLHRFFQHPSWKRGIVFGVLSLAVGLASFYYLLFYSVATTLLIPAYWIRYRPRLTSLPALLLPTAAGAAIMMIVALPYLHLFTRYEFTGEPRNFDLATFFLPPSGSLLYSSFAQFRHPDHFLGFVPILLAVVGVLAVLVKREDKVGRIVWASYAMVGLAAFFFAAGPDLNFAGVYYGEGPFRILQLFGPFEKLREPARFTVLVYLVLALFAAKGLLVLLRRFPSQPLVLSSLVIALVLAEQWSPERTKGTRVPTGESIPKAYEWLAKNPPDGPVVELPVWPFYRIRYTSLEAYFSTIHERPIPFGKPSFYPPALELLQWELRDFPDPRSLYLLRTLGFNLAVVHPKRWTKNKAHYLKALEHSKEKLPLIASFPNRDNPDWEHYRLGGERIYLIGTEPEQMSPVECDCVEIDRTEWTLEANGVTPPELAIDGDRQTKWTTGKMQQEGYYFEISFATPRRPVRVEIEMAFPYGEFARNLEMNGYRGRRGYRVAQIEDLTHKAELFQQLVEEPTKAKLRYDLKEMSMERLRLFINRTEEGTIGWSIPEIHVYEKRKNRRNNFQKADAER